MGTAGSVTTLRRYTPDQIGTLAGSIRKRLADRLAPEPGLRNVLELFKFRDGTGRTWTLGPATGIWYGSVDGRWSKQQAPPDAALDGPLDLDALASLPLKRMPEVDEAAGAQESSAPADAAAYIQEAVARVAQAYADAAIHSDAAEALLEGIYAVDASGTVWTVGVNSHEWYTFEGNGWTRAPHSLTADDFTPSAQGAAPKFCANCGHALVPGNKFCPNCGTPVPQGGGGNKQQAQENVSRFLTSDADLFPEPIVAPWDPPSGYPESIRTCPHCTALNVGDLQTCVSCGKPLDGAKGKATASPGPQAAAPAKATTVTASSPASRPAAPARPPQAEAAAPPKTPPSPAAPGPAPARRRGIPIWAVGAGGCVVLICLAVIGFAGYRLLAPSNTPQPQLPPTAEVNVIPIEPGGPVLSSGVLLEDMFDDPSRTAVPLFGPKLMEFTVDAGAGTLIAHSRGALVAMYDSPSVADFDATLGMWIPSPVSGAGYGLVFRSDDAQGGLNYYYAVLLMPADGQVVLKRWDSAGVTDVAAAPQTFDSSSPVEVGVRAQGSVIDISINGTALISTQDGGIPGPGIFGLLVDSPKDGDLAIFEQFTVVSLP
jgi:hypothetical protein